MQTEKGVQWSSVRVGVINKTKRSRKSLYLCKKFEKMGGFVLRIIYCNCIQQTGVPMHSGIAYTLQGVSGGGGGGEVVKK